MKTETTLTIIKIRILVVMNKNVVFLSYTTHASKRYGIFQIKDLSDKFLKIRTLRDVLFIISEDPF